MNCRNGRQIPALQFFDVKRSNRLDAQFYKGAAGPFFLFLRRLRLLPKYSIITVYEHF